MEQFNKALSFILGLIVVAVFIIVASGKFNIKGLPLAKSTTSAKITPKVTPQTTPTPTKKPLVNTNINTKTNTKTVSSTNKSTTIAKITPKIDPNFHSYSGGSTPTSIPSTGVPIVMFPLLGTSLFTGILMKRSQKKD